MTKEELYEKLSLPSEMYKSYTEKNLNEFFESNVCIPKGTNRHPFADVLHEWIEGTKVECRYLANDSFEWKNNLTLPSLDYEYRIKPSEPVYEWQWVYGQRGNSSRSARLSEHCTINELFTKFTDDIDVYFYMPVDETRRERKQ